MSVRRFFSALLIAGIIVGTWAALDMLLGQSESSLYTKMFLASAGAAYVGLLTAHGQREEPE